MSDLPRSLPISILWMALCLTIGCDSSTTAPSTDASSDPAGSKSRPVVVVVNYPLEYFARRIGGDLVQVTFPVPDDRDPEYWEPNTAEISKIQAADLILLNGADYAKWTLRSTLPWSRVTVTSETMEDALIEIPDAVVHSHGPEQEHSHAGLVSETWLDPSLAIRQARAVYDALCGLLPDQKSNLEPRFLELQQDLQTWADQLDSMFAEQDSAMRWLSAKPKFHYLLARYNKTTEVLHWDAAKTIESSQWELLEERLNGAPAVLLWAETPQDATLDRLAAAGVQSVVIDTAASRPQDGDFLAVMRNNVAAIHSALASHPRSTKPDY